MAIGGIIIAVDQVCYLFGCGAEGIREIVLEVASLNDAKDCLNSKGLLGETEQGHLTIAPSAVRGLSIRLRKRKTRD